MSTLVKFSRTTWRREWDSNPRHGRTREPDFEHATRAMRQRWLVQRAGRFMGIV